ncbi:MAG TPA: hypothetical protein VK178_04430 [Opitutaceae bacterium]|nr:hypothetical protein [Opitutaceae bacterium]
MSPIRFLCCTLCALAALSRATAGETPEASPPAQSALHAAGERHAPTGELPVTSDRVELNLRQFGAIGDGQPHPVSEWVVAKKFRNLVDIQRKYPFVTSLEWSADEVAFRAAVLALPPEGGTIQIPAGRYVATAHGWKINRDHVRLVGAGARDTMLSTGPKLEEGLVLSPYRHGGWQHGIDKEYPFSPDSGVAGADRIRLREPARAGEFQPGELVFVRNGGCLFDQDYGEFNEIAGTTPEGDLVFKHPLARDYTIAALNWATETAEPFTLPAPGKTVRVRVRTGTGFAEVPKAGAITVGEMLLEIVRREADSVTLRAPARGPTQAGTVLPTGTKIAKSRSVIRLTRSTRDFSAQGLRVFGRRKALNLSNSYETTFIDCDFVRRPDATTTPGGLTVDGDGGRFATFTRCTIRGTEPAPMQFARSFGDITFENCTFVATNVVFSEFCFGGTLRRSRLQTPATLGSAVIVGRSCGDLRIEENEIVVPGGPLTVFDATSDIHSQKLDSPGRLVIRSNRVVAPAKPRLFLLRHDRPAQIEGNTLNNAPVEPPAKTGP